MPKPDANLRDDKERERTDEQKREDEQRRKARERSREDENDEKVEEASRESFPASDPPAHSPRRSGRGRRER